MTLDEYFKQKKNNERVRALKAIIPNLEMHLKHLTRNHVQYQEIWNRYETLRLEYFERTGIKWESPKKDRGDALML